jgi:apolipoprotein N-acyltransferase
VRSAWIGEIFIPLLIVAVLFNAGLRHLRREIAPERTLKVMLMQPSIPQTVIWDAAEDVRRFEHLVEWSSQILNTNHADVLVWPESAVPKMVRYDTNTFNAITNLAVRHHVWMIVGSDDAEPKAGAANPDEADYFNSSFLVSPNGELRQRYIKRNLVIFGEYLPLQNWLPFLRVFTPITGGFVPGTHPVQFDMAPLAVKTSVLICFEDVFPQLAPSDVHHDTDFLVNITNDGWFGESAEQWQHGVSAVFRAVENRLPLVRCTNNGLTCWVDANGRIREIFSDNRGTIYGPGFLAAEIPLGAKGALHEPTFYTRHGDWFGWGCVAIAGAVLLRRLIPTFGLLKSRHAS